MYYSRADIKAEINQIKQELAGKKPEIELEVKQETEDQEKDSEPIKEYKMEKAK